MPIPTRSHSVRSAANAPPPASKTRVTSQHEPKNGEGTQNTSSATRGISTLPQPRKVAASGLPRIANGHARTQSASATNVLQAYVVQSITTSVPPTAGVKPGVESNPRTHNTISRFGHLRSQSTVLGKATKPQSSLKPAFNTYQQQFGTVKARHDDQSAVAQVGTRPPSSLDATSSQRDELLQLILVHIRSQNILKQYSNSAASKLDARALKYRREQAEVTVLEQKQQEDVNVLGLVDWLAQWDERTALEKVHILDSSVQQLVDMTNDEGEFSELIQQFEAWHTDAQGFLTGRSRSVVGSSADAWSTSELKSAWHQSVGALRIRLEFCQGSLLELGQVGERCALGRLISGHLRLARSMLEELELCSRLHSSFTMYRQQDNARYVEQIISEIQAGTIETETVRRKPVWETS